MTNPDDVATQRSTGQAGPLRRPEVVTFGEPMALLVAAGRLPLPVARGFDLGVAGAESNLATGLARLGHRVAYFGRVGADSFGDGIRRELRAEGIDVDRLVGDPERPTGLLIRDNPHGRPITVDYRRSGSAATALSRADLPRELISRARLLHVTGITAALSESALDATEQAMIIAAEAGVAVSLDPNIRLRLADADQWRSIIDRLARHASIVFTGRDEADLISPGIEPQDWYAERGAQIVVVKDGAAGATEHQVGTDRRPPVSVGIREVPLVDPIGAGDAFNAGWISAWLDGVDDRAVDDRLAVDDLAVDDLAVEGQGVEDRAVVDRAVEDQGVVNRAVESQAVRAAERRLTTAAAVASLVVSAPGDAVGLPTRSMLDQVLGSGADVIR